MSLHAASTGDEAVISKLSAAEAGYYDDEFACLFASRRRKRSPLVNRGYAFRVASIDEVVSRFLKSVGQADIQKKAKDELSAEFMCQIVSLGSGSDSRVLRFLSNNKFLCSCRYIEVDYPKVVEEKARILETEDKSRKCLSKISTYRARNFGKQHSSSMAENSSESKSLLTHNGAETTAVPSATRDVDVRTSKWHAKEERPSLVVHSFESCLQIGDRIDTKEQGEQRIHDKNMSSQGEGYQSSRGKFRLELVGQDLSDIEGLNTAFTIVNCEEDIPTLILSECVMGYMELWASDALLSHLATYFSSSLLVIYDFLRPFDAFGKTRQDHFSFTNNALRGAHAAPSLQRVTQRVKERGWILVRGLTMGDAMRCVVNSQEQRRMLSQEMFDEEEDWILYGKHYSMVLAMNVPDALQEDEFAKSTSGDGDEARWWKQPLMCPFFSFEQPSICPKREI